MSVLLVLVLLWVIIAIVAVLPHKLGIVDFVFLYFINTIAVVLTFTTLMLDMKLFIDSTEVDKMIAFMLYRIVGIPLLLVLLANVWFYPIRNAYKWMLACLFFLTLNVVQLLLKEHGMVIYKQWDLLRSFAMYAAFMMFSISVGLWFVRLDRRDVSHL
jgi:hypothetical protein